MSGDDNEELARTRRVQALTCPCCLLSHADAKTLRAHLVAKKAQIDQALEKLPA